MKKTLILLLLLLSISLGFSYQVIDIGKTTFNISSAVINLKVDEPNSNMFQFEIISLNEVNRTNGGKCSTPVLEPLNNSSVINTIDINDMLHNSNYLIEYPEYGIEKKTYNVNFTSEKYPGFSMVISYISVNSTLVVFPIKGNNNTNVTYEYIIV